MNFAKNELARHWADLSPRERRLSVAVLLLVLSYGAYLGFYQPLAEQNRLLTQKIQSQRQTYHYLRQIGGQAAALRQRAPDAGVSTEMAGQSPLALVDASSQEFELKAAIKHLSPEGEAKVNLRLENVGFDKLMAWLATLETRHRLLVLQIDVEKQVGGEGMVNAKILLGAG